MYTHPTTLAALRQKMHCGVYLSLQALRHRPVAAHMRQLAQWESLSRAEYQTLCRRRLKIALSYARARVCEYAGGRWSGARADDLATWPILSRDHLQDHLDTINAMPGQRLVYRTSSASTAKPVRVAWDGPGIAWAWANEYRGLSWHGVGIASRTLILWG